MIHNICSVLQQTCWVECILIFLICKWDFRSIKYCLLGSGFLEQIQMTAVSWFFFHHLLLDWHHNVPPSSSGGTQRKLELWLCLFHLFKTNKIYRWTKLGDFITEEVGMLKNKLTIQSWLDLQFREIQSSKSSISLDLAFFFLNWKPSLITQTIILKNACLVIFWSVSTGHFFCFFRKEFISKTEVEYHVMLYKILWRHLRMYEFYLYKQLYQNSLWIITSKNLVGWIYTLWVANLGIYIYKWFL